MKKTELLAPAGNMECLKAAIAAGADAIYLGGSRFGARAYAGNFSDEELTEALKLAHFFDKKIYLTINTLTRESELDELVPWMEPFYEAGLDGVIIQDLGVLERCRKAFPGLLLHASTQMTVTESESALFLKSLGVSRIVPARELCLEEILELKQETGMELEVFIHGALCYCYSGQCLFSSILGGRSGNRGRCAQPCRLPYSVMSQESVHSKKGQGKGEQYPLSLKDLCVLPLLPKLLDAGIDSFKIEGRMKSPEYVAGVTSIYRKYMDLYERNPQGWSVEPKDLDFLSGLYVRSELGSGYYEKHNGKEMVTLQKPGYAGNSEEVLEQIRREYLQEGLTKTVDLSAVLEQGQPVLLEAQCGGFSARAAGMTVMPAHKRPLTKEDVEKQLKKTGGSHFAPGRMEIRMEENIFLPVSALNELRRKVLDELYGMMTADRGFRSDDGKKDAIMQNIPFSEKECLEVVQKEPVLEAPDRTPKALQLYVSVLDMKQAMEAADSIHVKRLYVSADALLLDQDAASFWEAVSMRRIKDRGFSLFLTLPVILRSYSAVYFEELMELVREHENEVDGLMACSLSGILWAHKAGWKKKFSLQHTAYVFNRETWNFYMRHFQIDSYTAPLEYNRKELKTLPQNNQEMVVYGRIPMMISAGCIRKTEGLCQVSHSMRSLEKGLPRRTFDFSLKDRYQAQFPVYINCRHCMNTIYNSVPLSLHQYLPEIGERLIRAVRLDFTNESVSEVENIIRFYAAGEGEPPKAYTTGHYKKGVQ